MSLPKVLTPTKTIDVDGALFDVRALTRAEAARFQKMVSDGANLGDLEIEVIAAATDTPRDEVRDWYEATPSHVAEALMSAIKDISRLDEGAQKSS